MARSAIKRQPLWRISIATTPEAEDAVSEMAGSLLKHPASTFFNVESGMSLVTVYCDTKPVKGVRKRIADALAQIKNCGLNIGRARIAIAKIRHEDWAESWKRHFKPIEIGSSLLVKPSWSRRKPEKNQPVVILDPGLSFGTGQHPTTEFCLREIVRRRKTGMKQSFLDIGTGSGILAIAAAKLGYHPVHALDFDASSVEIARVNARRNSVSGKIRFWRGDVAKLAVHPAGKYDLICANLISDLLVTQRRRIVAQLDRGGILVLAGILKSEFDSVRTAFANLNLKPAFSQTEKEWRSGSFRQR
ncbi:MAG TPA: 50S ribosomal protein L11 methyltransferase [Verrucomicrobiae bacterium]|nr:50S ribosomal protein L11 methyltransferase [Verrucomicrobiae bacterium]